MMKKFLLLGVIALLAACDRAPSNVKTLVTTDCGVSWTVVAAGQRVPTSVGTCEYKTVLPDYPMQGDTEFQAQFAGNVLVKIKITYDYEIVDGLKFIKEAKFLGKSGSAADSAANTQMSAFETAENVVIDVRLRENAEAATKAARAAERQKLVDALSDKQDAAIKDMTPEQIKARIEELDGGAAPAAAK